MDDDGLAGSRIAKRRTLREMLLPIGKGYTAYAREEMSVAWRFAWTFTLWYAILCIGIALAMLGPTLQELAEQLHLRIAEASVLFTARAAGYVVGAILFNDLLEKLRNPAAVFFIPLLPCFFGPMLLPRMRTLLMTCVLFMCQGMCMGVLDTGGNVAMLSLWRGSSWQNGFEHAFHFLFGLGAAVAPMFVRWMLEHNHAAMAAWPVVGVITLPVCILMGILVYAPQPETSHDEVETPDQRRSFLVRVITLTGAFLFVYVGIEVAYGGYIDSFSVRWVGASKVDGATLTAVYWGALCVGRFVAAVITPFVHHARYLAVHLALAIASTATLGIKASDPSAVAPHTDGWWWGIVVPTAVFGFALAPLFPGALLVAEELLDGPLPTKWAGNVVGGAAAGEMLLPMVVGVCFSYWPMSFCWLQLGLCLVTAVIFLANSAGILSSGKT